MSADTITAEWTPRQADFDGFAALSGDDNPIHVDPDFSARTRFGRTVAHGMLLHARLWTLIRAFRPGRAIAGQNLMFLEPSFADETLVLSVAANADDPGRLACTIARKADGEVTVTGECFLGGAA